MKNADKKLTSVRVEPDLFTEFKSQCLKDKFSLQKLVSRSIFLYLTEDEFKDKLHKINNVTLNELHER